MARPDTFKQFQRKLKAFGQTLTPERYNVFIRRLGLDFLTRLVLKTPVDTGHARANWQVDINTIPKTEIEFSVPGLGPKDSAGAVNLGGKTIKQQTTSFADFKMGTIAYIVNNVNYVRHLEHGTPKMAPFAMRSESVAELLETFS